MNTVPQRSLDGTDDEAGQATRLIRSRVGWPVRISHDGCSASGRSPAGTTRAALKLSGSRKWWPALDAGFSSLGIATSCTSSRPHSSLIEQVFRAATEAIKPLTAPRGPGLVLAIDPATPGLSVWARYHRRGCTLMAATSPFHASYSLSLGADGSHDTRPALNPAAAAAAARSSMSRCE